MFLKAIQYQYIQIEAPEHIEFELDGVSFAVVQVHFQINLAKHYSLKNAEAMLKSHSSKKMFKTYSRFGKFYQHSNFLIVYGHY